MNEVVKVESPVVASAHIKLTPYAIEFDGTPSIEEWYNTIKSVENVHGMCQFYIGDLMVYAESPVTGWGESKYDELEEATGYENQTLRHFAMIARRFDKDFREKICSASGTSSRPVTFEHFKEVASLDDNQARYLLEMVRDGGWNRAKLRESVQRLKHHGELPEPREPRELPDGWLPFKELPKEAVRGYVPAPERIDGPQSTFLIQFEEWELEQLYNDYKDDDKMLSLCDRIATALRG